MQRMLALLTFVPAAAFAGDWETVEALAAKAPADVAAAVERRLECNHWAGEEPYDAERAQEIADAVARLDCGALDADETVLLTKYAGRDDVQELIEMARETF